MNDSNTEQNELFSSVPPADDAAPADETPAVAPVPPVSAPNSTPAAEKPASVPASSAFIIDESEDEEEAARSSRTLPHRSAPPAAPRHPHRHAPTSAEDPAAAAEFGARVRALRVKSGLSLDEVAAETLIKKDYLVALETGDFDALPASVYVTAYLRRVCRLYGADAAESDALVQLLHDHLSYEIPDIAVKVHDLETDEHEQRKVRQIVFGIIAAAVLLVLTLVVAAVLLFSGRGRGRGTAPFDESTLQRLQPRAELKISILPAPEPGK